VRRAICGTPTTGTGEPVGSGLPRRWRKSGKNWSLSCFRPLLAGWLIVIIKQDPHRRCIGVLMLPGLISPEKSDQKNERNKHATADKKENSTHDQFLFN